MRAWKLGFVIVAVLALLGTQIGCSDSTSPVGTKKKEVLVGFFHVNPASTYLHTCDDYGAVDAVPIVLADSSLAPGDVIRIEVSGQFWAGGTEYDGLFAVFSSSSTLLSGSELDRVPDAIGVGVDEETPVTYQCSGEPTDIPEDFYCTPERLVTIPAGATHLFLSASDVYFGDNTDTDGDFGINIWKRE